MSKIIGIDPGINFTGWSIITVEQNNLKLQLEDFGIITPKSSLSTSERLKYIYNGIKKVIEEFSPNTAAIEETFVSKDPRGSLKLAYARGIALMVPSLYDIPVFEYAPTTIKKVVANNGHASKEAIKLAITFTFPSYKDIINISKDDAIDAISIALCHHYKNAINNVTINY